MERFEREERRGTNFVVDAVEEPRHHGEDGGLKGLHVVRQESDVTLEKSHPAASPVYHRLKWQGTWVNSGGRPLQRPPVRTSPAPPSRTCELKAGRKW